MVQMWSATCESRYSEGCAERWATASLDSARSIARWGLGDGVLAVVVVDLDRVVALQLREVVEQKVHKVSASFSSEGPVWSRMTTVSR